MDVYFGNTVGVYEQIDECICSRVSHYCHTPSWVNRVLCVQEPSDVPLLVSFGDFPLASFFPLLSWIFAFVSWFRDNATKERNE